MSMFEKRDQRAIEAGYTRINDDVKCPRSVVWEPYDANPDTLTKITRAAQCRSCPVLPHCELAANELDAAQRTGVWACVDRAPTVGRPPKEGDAA